MAVFSVPANAPGHSVSLAHDSADVWDALRLRYVVRTAGSGAPIDSPVPGIDIEEPDLRGEHLLVREGATGMVVATCRLLPPEAGEPARPADRFASPRPVGLRGSVVEAGPLCVHPGHRDDAVVSLLWSGVIRYLRDNGHTWLTGRCPVPPHVADPGTAAFFLLSVNEIDARLSNDPVGAVR